MDSSERIIGEALELFNEGLTPYLRTSCRLYGVTWPAEPATPVAGLDWNPAMLLASLDTVVKCWDQLFQETLEPSFLNLIPGICAAIDA